MAINHKNFNTSTKAVDDVERTVEVIISDETVDRDDDIISVDGWDLENYLKNPVVFFGHDTSAVPIAQCVKIGVEGGKLIATAKFPDAGKDHFSDSVFNAISDRRVRSTSVGFRSKRHELIEGGGVKFLEQELMEFSFVGVPANPSAVLRTTPEMVQWAKSIAGTKRSKRDDKIKAKHILDAVDKNDEGDDDEKLAFKVDDMVKCSKGSAIVERVIRDNGTVEIDGQESITGTDDEPVAVVEMLANADEGEGMYKTGEKAAFKFADLSPIEENITIVDAPVEDDDDSDKALSDEMQECTDFDLLFASFLADDAKVKLKDGCHSKDYYLIAKAGLEFDVLGVTDSGMLKLYEKKYDREILVHPLGVELVGSEKNLKAHNVDGEAVTKRNDGPKAKKRKKIADVDAAAMLSGSIESAFNEDLK